MKRRQFLIAMAAMLAGEKVGAQTLVQRRLRCPILMYHYVSPLPANADRYRQDLTVAPSLFDQHCAFLRDEGYTTIHMRDLYQALFKGARLPDKPIVLTFDDGYVDAFTYVLPTLQRYDMVGTFFIVSQFMEGPGYLNWGQAGLMLELNMEIENHSRTHANLAGKDESQLMDEIDGAAQAIAITFGKRSRFFCYPAGHYDDRTMQVVRETGHLLAVTTEDGMVHDSTDPFRLKRVRIRGTTGVTGLAWLLAR